MKKNKLIIVSGIVCIVVIIICIILLLINTKSKNNGNQIQEDNNLSGVEIIRDAKITYNIGKCINDMIEYTFKNISYNMNDTVLVPRELLMELNLDDGLKTFYINKAYVANLEDNISVYFAEGYMVNENGTKLFNDNCIKKPIKISLKIDNEYNTGYIGLYGKDYMDFFKYYDDISKTKILKTSGLKILKKDSNFENLDEVLINDALYQNRQLDEDIDERSMVNWYYTDYKINQAEKGNKKMDNSYTYRYEGNFDDGYIIIDQNDNELRIKPSSDSMEYDVN